jgi:hypothetical protein
LENLQVRVNIAGVDPEVQEGNCVRVPLEQKVAGAHIVALARFWVQPDARIPAKEVIHHVTARQSGLALRLEQQLLVPAAGFAFLQASRVAAVGGHSTHAELPPPSEGQGWSKLMFQVEAQAADLITGATHLRLRG